MSERTQEKDVRALTIRQPWASLIACGAKTVETRSWSTAWRGTLLIHAAKEGRGFFYCRYVDNVLLGSRATETQPMDLRMPAGHHIADPGVREWPRMAVVAVARLADVVPVVDASGCRNTTAHLCVVSESGLLHSPVDSPWPDGETEHIVSDQLPLGDFTPGRFAWLLTDVRPLPEPIAAKGRQGLWRPDPDLVAATSTQP